MHVLLEDWQKQRFLVCIGCLFFVVVESALNGKLFECVCCLHEFLQSVEVNPNCLIFANASRYTVSLPILSAWQW